MEEKSFALVVDASEAQVLDTLATLQGAGWDGVGTTDPWEAIALLSRHSFDLIVLDLEMQDPGVFDVCSIVAEDPGLQDTPVIFFSQEALRPPFARPRLVRLQKPVEESALLDAVRKLRVWPFPPEEKRDSRTRFVRRRRDPASAQPA